MVVKVRKSGIPKQYLFNLAGGAFVLATVVLGVRYTVFAEAVPVCEDRYARTTSIPLASASGVPLTKANFQSRIGGREWGVFEHASIAKKAGASDGVMLTVDLPRPTSTDRKGGTARYPGSGLGFDWRPGVIGAATSGCLSYEIFLPKTWSYNASGVLPGLYGGRKGMNARSREVGSFEARVAWSYGPRLGINLYRGGREHKVRVGTEPPRYHVPVGRWVMVVQEIALNTPGKADGVMRLWVDGDLRLDLAGVKIYDGKERPRLLGVTADTHYGDPGDKWQGAPQPTKIMMTPFRLYWN